MNADFERNIKHNLKNQNQIFEFEKSEISSSKKTFFPLYVTCAVRENNESSKLVFLRLNCVHIERVALQ